MANLPTPYPSVNAALQELLERIRAILGGQLVGMYLYGSLAIGDFDPAGSDIDFLVVTGGDLADEQLASLQEMHRQFDRGGSPWAARVEAAYLPVQALNQVPEKEVLYPQVEKGTALFRGPLEDGWTFQRHTLLQHGIVVWGPGLGKLIQAVSMEEMRQAAYAIMDGWLEQSRGNAEWIAWARRREAQSFMVLTLCRLLFSLGTGEVTSKLGAARWASEHLGARWEALVARSLAGLHDESDTPESEYDEMLAFLEFAGRRCRGDNICN